MPTFGAWWSGEDIPLRRELELLDDAGVAEEQQARERQKSSILRRLRDHQRLGVAGRGERPSPLEVTRACLADLAASPAEVVLVNLEDLWDERRPQNIPGTGSERPNWRRKAAHAVEHVRSLPPMTDTLAAVARLRSGDSSVRTSGNS
jgi:4-alpha-glucanotransferase